MTVEFNTSYIEMNEWSIFPPGTPVRVHYWTLKDNGERDFWYRTGTVLQRLLDENGVLVHVGKGTTVSITCIWDIQVAHPADIFQERFDSRLNKKFILRTGPNSFYVGVVVREEYQFDDVTEAYERICYGKVSFSYVVDDVDLFYTSTQEVKHKLGKGNHVAFRDHNDVQLLQNTSMIRDGILSYLYNALYETNLSNLIDFKKMTIKKQGRNQKGNWYAFAKGDASLKQADIYLHQNAEQFVLPGDRVGAPMSVERNDLPGRSPPRIGDIVWVCPSGSKEIPSHWFRASAHPIDGFMSWLDENGQNSCAVSDLMVKLDEDTEVTKEVYAMCHLVTRIILHKDLTCFESVAHLFRQALWVYL